MARVTLEEFLSMFEGGKGTVDGESIKKVYFGINGIARKIKKVHIGVDGVASLLWSSSMLGQLEIGDTVQLNVNGTATDFIVVHQGNPDASLYDDSCNGTWLLMKDLYEKRVWDSSNNDYENSDIHAYLNGTFLGLFDSDIQSAIKQVKIPYRKGTGSGGSTVSGSSGLSAKIFLLSGYEVGWTTSNSQYFPVDGACLDYFSGTSAVDSKRIGYYDGTATRWWLRSPYTNDTYYVWGVYTTGYCSSGSCSGSHGVRPVLILPSDFELNNSDKFSVTSDDNGNVTFEGLTVASDDNGNVAVEGVTLTSDENGNVTIGG